MAIPNATLTMLESLARAAPQGCFHHDHGMVWDGMFGQHTVFIDVRAMPPYANRRRSRMARYIAASSPDVMLALIAELRRLRAIVEMGECFICGEPAYCTPIKEGATPAHDSCFAGRAGPDEPRFGDKASDLTRRPDGSLYRI